MEGLSEEISLVGSDMNKRELNHLIPNHSQKSTSEASA